MKDLLSSTLILASASPRRRDLLAEAGIAFEIASSESMEGVVEQKEHAHGAKVLAIENALLKARAVASKFPGRWVLGADTVVVCTPEVLGKPADLEEARRMLRKLSGRTHEVMTGVALVKEEACAEGCNFEEHRFVEATRVTFHALDAEGIEAYLERVSVLDKAGAYAAQECGEMIISDMDGDFDNVVGLPVQKLKAVLKELGIFPCVAQGE